MGKGAWKKGNFAGSAKNWQTGYAGAQAALTAGVANPSRDPTAAAVAQQAALVSGFNAAVSSGMWANNLRAAGQATWQQGMQAYAATGLSTKAAKGAPRYQAFAAQYGPQVMSQVNSLPARGPAGSNQARSANMNDWQHAQRGKYRHAWRGGAG